MTVDLLGNALDRAERAERLLSDTQENYAEALATIEDMRNGARVPCPLSVAAYDSALPPGCKPDTCDGDDDCMVPATDPAPMDPPILNLEIRYRYATPGAAMRPPNLIAFSGGSLRHTTTRARAARTLRDLAQQIMGDTR